MDALAALAVRWRDEAETFRAYGASTLASACDKHAEELEAAMDAAHLEALTLDEAAELGGYSYSHLQHLVADGEIRNVGSKGSPRIRRCDVPRKPGHGQDGATSKAELMDRSLRLHRTEAG